MKARPILFSGPMVRALLDGRKTQTRRIVDVVAMAGPNETHGSRGGWREATPGMWQSKAGAFNVWSKPKACPYGAPGNLLWVREAFSYETLDVDRDRFMEPWFWADGNPTDGDYTRPKPSIHMPRLYSRLTLEITDVRVERLKAISEADAIAEGASECANGWWFDRSPSLAGSDARGAYYCLWEAINGPDSWAANPWVWALTFKVHRANVDAVLAERGRA